ncbi:T9SS type A sorting domain-containing protein [Psychroserpens algicola]|uniref:T9SS type A sorting domain-containing protein n=1 Tax=Psychroserpens algicola TaxID=1719034 RepID=UPI0019531F79|nr:T9SS type A sorting domain-containing protein [Psychroserpens algicola]
MKKITLKISAFLLFALSALQVQGQTCPEIYLGVEDGGNGDAVYKLATCGLSPELYLTINASAGEGDPLLIWQTELTGAAAVTQNWAIQDHVAPAGSGFIQITADLTSLGAGEWTMVVNQASYDGSGGDSEVQIDARPGTPQDDTTVVAPNPEAYGFDQFQRRRESGWGGPGNNALFAKPSPTGGNAQGNLRYSTVPSMAGDPVLMQSGGTIQEMRWIYVEDLPLSVEEFDTSSVVITNPVKDQLTIEGLNQSIKQISVYDLLGKQVISSNIEDDASSSILDVSILTSGIYIVKLQGENGVSVAKKIIKE